MGRRGIRYFKDQSYEKLLKHHKKLGCLFNDPLFPPTNSSIGNIKDLPTNIVWKRPNELVEAPCLFGKHMVSRTIAKGHLSSAWMISAFSMLAGMKEICHKVIPDYRTQEWDPEKPADHLGIFHFRFWRFGSWVDVAVDDLLPTVDGQLLFTQSCHEHEFWTSLVEKAYAKLLGSYEALLGGHLCDALVDFTGGVTQTIDLAVGALQDIEEKRNDLFEMMQNEMNSVLCATIAVSDEQEAGKRTEVGLTKGYAYPITGVKKVHLGETGLRQLFSGREKFAMVRLLDPRGIRICSTPKSVEGSGEYAFSTSELSKLLSTNPEWAKVKDSQRERIGLTFNEEGEFWMPLEDFVSHFTDLVVCRLVPSNIFAVGRRWAEFSAAGTWSSGMKGTSSDRSGGCSAFPDSFLRNPQYVFDIKHEEEEIMVQLLQGDLNQQSSVDGHSLLIGFSIIKVEMNRRYRLHKLWEHTPYVVRCEPIRRRQIFYRGVLSCGRYIIMPVTHKPGDNGHYLLRLFAANNIQLRELKSDVPKLPVFWCCTQGPQWVTVVNIVSANQLKRAEMFTFPGSCPVLQWRPATQICSTAPLISPDDAAGADTAA
ncbi:calpain-5-like isoform X2 [Bacillus rossius redtenbacheri]|uniref:calpain-5-like isoform X2 n=1 Tax=Bacillus rossius redtenbacheri TaxID=93214 RepID=UPI002FDE76F3